MNAKTSLLTVSFRVPNNNTAKLTASIAPPTVVLKFLVKSLFSCLGSSSKFRESHKSTYSQIQIIIARRFLILPSVISREYPKTSDSLRTSFSSSISIALNISFLFLEHYLIQLIVSLTLYAN